MADFERFRYFVETVLDNGVARFRMPVPTASGYQERAVQLEKGTYTHKQSGMGATVSFVLIIYDW